MKKTELEFIGLSVSGYSEDYWISDDEKINFGACGLMKEVGAFSLDWKHQILFEQDIPKNISEAKEGWILNHCLGEEEELQQYRAAHNRFYPPVYRIKLSVEAEEVSEEEAAEFWKKRRIENND